MSANAARDGADASNNLAYLEASRMLVEFSPSCDHEQAKRLACEAASYVVQQTRKRIQKTADTASEEQ